MRGLFLLVIVVAAPPPPGTVVYSNDFQVKPGSAFPEWSSSRIAYVNRERPSLKGDADPQAITNVDSPRGGRRFLGEFGGPRLDPAAHTRVRQTIRLALKDLPPHEEVKVAFDLLILKSWDGNSPWYGPDRWRLKVGGGPTLLDTTFSNNPKVAAEKSDQNYPRPGSAPHAGAISGGQLGYSFFGDSIYHLEYAFHHNASTLVIEFASDLFEGKGTGDESWGLDNVRVTVGPKG